MVSGPIQRRGERIQSAEQQQTESQVRDYIHHELLYDPHSNWCTQLGLRTLATFCWGFCASGWGTGPRRHAGCKVAKGDRCNMRLVGAGHRLRRSIPHGYH